MTSADSQGKLPAFVMLAGTLISLSGLTWDIDWHLDVGPDSFFTLLHLQNGAVEFNPFAVWMLSTGRLGFVALKSILITLPPGAYTTTIRGKNNATGVGLVEAFLVN